jgi:hypothetical protein
LSRVENVVAYYFKLLLDIKMEFNGYLIIINNYADRRIIAVMFNMLK